ncbi:uncharacterized protein J3D65DRAFT_626443 [Phyllosticta citribraziliensis]|uniref:Uncharacterized protein n=1 Tax=Phyllosticta citribraziliensis TaxID=989973 RepID=A0ABR1LKW3_9PEZI
MRATLTPPPCPLDAALRCAAPHRLAAALSEGPHGTWKRTAQQPSVRYFLCLHATMDQKGIVGARPRTQGLRARRLCNLLPRTRSRFRRPVPVPIPAFPSSSVRVSSGAAAPGQTRPRHDSTATYMHTCAAADFIIAPPLRMHARAPPAGRLPASPQIAPADHLISSVALLNVTVDLRFRSGLPCAIRAACRAAPRRRLCALYVRRGGARCTTWAVGLREQLGVSAADSGRCGERAKARSVDPVIEKQRVQSSLGLVRSGAREGQKSGA